MIEELMKAVLEGSQQQQAGGRQQAQQPSGDILGSILKGVLGGGQQQPAQRQQPQAPQGGDIFGEILKGVLGGGAQQQQQGPGNLGGIADILGDVLGGGGGGVSSGNPVADMAANMLAQKLGISPQIAGMVVSFAMAALMGKKMQANQGAAPSQQRGGRGRNQTQGGGVFGGLDLDDLLEGDFAFDSGLAAELAEKTGQTENESAYQLQEAVTMLTGMDKKKSRSKKRKTPKPAPKARPKSGNLESLLDTWEVD